MTTVVLCDADGEEAVPLITPAMLITCLKCGLTLLQLLGSTVGLLEELLRDREFRKLFMEFRREVELYKESQC